MGETKLGGVVEKRKKKEEKGETAAFVRTKKGKKKEKGEQRGKEKSRRTCACSLFCLISNATVFTQGSGGKKKKKKKTRWGGS